MNKPIEIAVALAACIIWIAGVMATWGTWNLVIAILWPGAIAAIVFCILFKLTEA